MLNLCFRLESLTRHLEDTIEERSEELAENKNNAESLLCELLPKSVFNNLKCGLTVEPEMFNDVTISFSDIVNFTRYVA